MTRRFKHLDGCLKWMNLVGRVQNLVKGLDHQVVKELVHHNHEIGFVTKTLELIILMHEYVTLKLE